MRVVLAADSFKGSLAASQVARHLATGLVRGAPDVDVLCVPIADGGEGTLDAAIMAGFRRVTATVAGPTGQLLESAFAVREGIAVVEMAAASGLSVLPAGHLEPLHASSRGTGDLIMAALDRGCDEIILGVGGSACTDGGSGLLVALGARLRRADGGPIADGGAALRELARVDLAGFDPRLGDVVVILASDVDNPLLGAAGAAAVYAPQKGASPADIEVLEAGLSRWAQALESEIGPAARTAVAAPGAGAAGGVGYAALVALHAVRRSGIDVVLDLVDFPRHLVGADLVITGEGTIDDQTLHGKAPAGVAAAARAVGIPVIAVTGRNLLSVERLAGAGFAQTYALTDLEPDVQRCMADAASLLELLGRRIAVDWLRDQDRPTVALP